VGHGAAIGVVVAFLGGVLDDGQAVPLVLGQAIDLGAELGRRDDGGAKAVEGVVEGRSGGCRLGGTGTPSACRGGLQPLPGDGEVQASLVAIVRGGCEVMAGCSPLVAAVRWDDPLEELEVVGVVGQAPAEDVDAVRKRVVGLGAPDGDFQWVSSWARRRVTSASRQPSRRLKASRSA